MARPTTARGGRQHTAEALQAMPHQRCRQPLTSVAGCSAGWVDSAAYNPGDGQVAGLSGWLAACCRRGLGLFSVGNPAMHG
jgi:hypothetical protein